MTNYNRQTNVKDDGTRERNERDKKVAVAEATCGDGSKMKSAPVRKATDRGAVPTAADAGAEIDEDNALSKKKKKKN